MAERRVNAKMLLVGSLPAGSAEHAFRAGAELFGDLVVALPDGETGPMAGWVSVEREQLIRKSEDIVVISETASPTGLPRHAYETPVFSVKRGRRACPLRPLAADRRGDRVLPAVQASCATPARFRRACASRSACRSRRAR